MIFRFCLTPNDLERIEPSLLQDRMVSLLRAHRFGHHFLVIDRITADWLLQNVVLPEKDKAILEAIRQSATQNGRLTKDAKISIYVSMPLTECKRIGDNVIQVPIDNPDFESIVKEPQLIVEDAESDGFVYGVIFNSIRSKPAV